MDLNSYKNMLYGLLPQGFAWPREKETNSEKLICAKATELQRVDSNVQSLLTEAYPLTSSSLLTDWERVTGLPDTCQLIGATVQERREAVHRKLSTIGGQSKQYYIDLALSLGYVVEISEYRSFRAGKSSAGDPVNGIDWDHAWLVKAPEESIRSFRAGQGAAGEPLRYWGNELLECVLSNLKPAHTHVIFAYGS